MKQINFNVATLKEAELLSRIYHVKKDDYFDSRAYG